MKFNRMVLAWAWRSHAASAFAAPTAVVEGVRCRSGSNAAASSIRCRRHGNSKIGQTHHRQNSRLLLRLPKAARSSWRENASCLSTSSGKARKTGRLSCRRPGRGARRLPLHYRHQVQASIRAARIDIRSPPLPPACAHTDLWGKSSSDRDVVCLDRSTSRCSARRMAPVDMGRRCSSTSRRKPRRPRRPLAANQGRGRPMRAVAGSGRQRPKSPPARARPAGRQVESSGRRQAPTRKRPEGLPTNLRAAGYAAEIHPVGSADKRSYEVRVGGLPSREEADALGVKIEAAPAPSALPPP